MELEEQIKQIVGFKNLIYQDTTNDFFLYPFMSMVLNLTDSKGFITELGLSCLFNEINKDFEIINECPEKPSQKALIRLCLYFTIAYNLTFYFGGFIKGLEADKLHQILEYQLKGLTKRLTDKYAKIYNEEKRKHWTKEIFQDSVHIPTHPDDLPKNYKQEDCISIN